MRILAVDTSTPYTFIADCGYNQKWSILKFAAVKVDKLHDNWMERLLLDFTDKDGLSVYDGFASGSGPGSFTGLRIGFTYLKTLALLRDRIFTVFSTPVFLDSIFCREQDTLLVQLNTNLYVSCDPKFCQSSEKIQPLENWFQFYSTENTSKADNTPETILLWHLYGEKPGTDKHFTLLDPEIRNPDEKFEINLPQPDILVENKTQLLASLPDYGHDVIAKRKL